MFLLDPTIPKDQEEIAKEFNATSSWKEYVDAQREDMENTVCTKYFSLLNLCKTLGIVQFNLHFVEARHRYTMVLYFMYAGSNTTNTNCPELVKTIDLFVNAMGNRDIDDPDGIVFRKISLMCCKQKRQS